MLRKVILALAIAGALVLGLETAVTYLAQRGMEEALERQYGLQESLRVRINSFPLIVSLARNRILDLRLEWEGDMCFSAGDGVVTVPYSCELRMCDVELDMPAVLRGRLELKSVSRLRSTLSFELADLGPLLGKTAPFSESDGLITVKDGTARVKYKVNVMGGQNLYFQPVSASTGTSEHAGEYEPVIEGSVNTFTMEGFPMEFYLLAASVEGDRLVIRIGVEEWEGYLDASISSS